MLTGLRDRLRRLRRPTGRWWHLDLYTPGGRLIATRRVFCEEGELGKEIRRSWPDHGAAEVRASAAEGAAIAILGPEPLHRE